MIAYSFLEQKKCNLEGKSIVVDGIAFQIYQIMNDPTPIETQKTPICVVIALLLAMVICIPAGLIFLLHAGSEGDDAVVIRVVTAFLVALDLGLCLIIIGLIQYQRILQKSRSVWIINEGKSFTVELDDDPGLEIKLTEWQDPSRIYLPRYPYMPLPPIRKLYVALIPMIMVFPAVQLCWKGGSFELTCFVTCFVGVSFSVGIIARQRMQEQRWKT